jgi:hypothetical protein
MILIGIMHIKILLLKLKAIKAYYDDLKSFSKNMSYFINSYATNSFSYQIFNLLLSKKVL